MTSASKPLVLSAPQPRTLDLIFEEEAKAELFARYDILEVEPRDADRLDPATLARVRYVLGQPPLAAATIDAMTQLRCVLNVESNLFLNMPYDRLFERGIHVVTTGAVFAEPVAEMGLALALCLLRDVVDADLAFRTGEERWGGDGNVGCRTLAGATVGVLGLGDLGRALARNLSGFRCRVQAHDPWLPASIVEERGCAAVGFDALLETSDVLFVTAAVTSENQGFLGAKQFASMKKGAVFVLLSRADVVDFEDLMEAVRSGHIRAASDVFPQEPLAKDHAVRALPGFLRSAHRAGALDSAFYAMGAMVLDDMALMDKGLPPMRCKRAERETVSRMRSRPVAAN